MAAKIETDVTTLPLESGDMQEAGAGVVRLRTRLNKAPSADWVKLFEKLVKDSNNNLVQNAGIEFEGNRLHYLTGTDKVTDEKHKYVKQFVADANKAAEAHNLKQDEAYKKSASDTQAQKAAFEDLQKRMTGK